MGLATRIRGALGQPIDPTGLAAFRILFGLLMAASVVRFVAYGWVDALIVAPEYHFTWWGLDWVRPWPRWAMFAHFAVMTLAALGVALGAAHRLCALVFFAAFTYVELIDKAYYLNHYYLVSVLALMCAALPLDRVWSVAAWRRARRNAPPAPVGAWASWALRLQLGLVYVYAGVAKLNPDWLLEAEPMRSWLLTRVEVPLIGPWLGALWVAYAMSWAGALYDLTVPFALLHRRTRPLAFFSVIVFHVLTWALFPIGVFPWLMIASATLFLAHDWPQTALDWLHQRAGHAAKANAARRSAPTPPNAPLHLPHRVVGALLALHLVAQLTLPARPLLYPGNTRWTEEGYRFGWRVMLIEKVGMVEFEVVSLTPPRRWRVYPRDALTPLQVKTMSTQPDMILQYAHHIAALARADGHRDVRVYAHAWATFNGRPSQRLIDPKADLAAEPRGSLMPRPWILPLREARR